MKRFIITVNGTDYDVAVREADAEIVSARVVSAPTEVVPEVKKTTEEKPAITNVSGGEKVLSPMPGTIRDIKVKLGDKVSKNQVLLIMEAMKMENEIVAPKDGVVKAIFVETGSTVDSGGELLSLE